MPCDKSAGPDGVNGYFMKKKWELIKHPFYQLCHAFYEGSLDLQSINSTYIALIPKMDKIQKMHQTLDQSPWLIWL
jgi:hypothetical protein